MKIALVIFHADPARGGAEGYTVQLAADLARRGQEVTLVATAFAPAADARGTGAAVRHVQLKSSRATRLSRYRAFVEAVKQHLSEEKYDVVHAISPVATCDIYHPQAGLAAEAMARGHLKYEGLRRPLSRLVTQLNPKRQYVASVERELLGRPDCPLVFCVSGMVKRTVQEFYHVDKAKLVTLFNAVDVRRFDPHTVDEARSEVRTRWNIAPDQVVALIVAQDFKRKGLRHAIEAVAKLREASLVLLVVGKPDPTPYKGLASSLGVADRIRFAGPAADTRPLYAAADFFVLPTYHDPCSIVVVEALAMGLPAITTARNGASELYQHGSQGFVVQDPADAGALASAMRALLDAGQRGAMRESALSLRPTLSQEAHVDRVVSLYEQIA